MPANYLSVIRSTKYKGQFPYYLAYHTQNKGPTTHIKSGMQKEEDYAVTNTEAGGIFMTTADNSSSPINPTHNYRGRPLSSYHDSEGYNHNNAVIYHGTGPDMVDYMLNDPTADPMNNAVPSRTDDYQKHQEKQVDQQPNMSSMDCSSGGGVTINNVDRTLSFADVMQFADFGPKLALNHPHRFQQQQRQDVNANPEYNRDHTLTGIEDDTVYFLKFPVLNNPHMVLSHRNTNTIRDDNNSITDLQDGGLGDPLEEFEGRGHQEEDAAPALAMAGTSNKLINISNPVQLEFLSNTFDNNTHNDNLMGLAKSDKTGNVNMEGVAGAAAAVGNNKSSSSSSKKKRPRTIKTNEEVESQRMTHIAVERNRRKQMNEHLRVLRSLMPSSYVQRGDQASIIGGAIEFVRELEQLLQCLESQKRRRLYGDQVQGRPMGDSSNSSSTVLGLVQQTPQVQSPLAFPPTVADNQYHHQDIDHPQLDPTAMPTPVAGGLVQEETAESKSCVADIEVKVLGFDALIKILSRRRPGQLIKAIAALEDLHFTILHTNITTIEQTVLYSFNVKVASEGRFTAEDIAGSVQQIFTFIHANTSII